jgi:hypothetical protein
MATDTTASFDHDELAAYVWRSVRAGSDTKTQKSRRTLEVPDEVARALKQHHTKQAAGRLRAGETCQDNDLVVLPGTANHSPRATSAEYSPQSPWQLAEERTGRRENDGTRSSRS